jgi:choline dehydrogenase-like flavoprotein
VHIDLDKVTESKPFHSTVCIVGAGIAGLIIALELAEEGFDVHLLEAGGVDSEQRSQDLYKTEMSAANHRGSNDGRFRTFGGSSTQWGGQLLPFGADIFKPPAGSPSAAWPITAADLSPYYENVQSILGVNSLPWSAKLLGALGYQNDFDSDDVILRFAKWVPFRKRNLAKTVGVEVMAHEGIQLFTHANVASFNTDSQDRSQKVKFARVLNYSKQEFYFTADEFILCAGTIESSRILLLSPDVPNHHDQIGRYFHDHVAYHAAQFDSPTRERIMERLGPFYVDGTIHSCKMEASPTLRARENLFAVMAHVVIIEPEDSGIAAIRNIFRSLQSGRFRESIALNLIPMIRGLKDVAKAVYYARFLRRRAISARAVLKLNIDAEQAPNRENRILLSSTDIDALGLPTTVVEWRIGEGEQDTAARYADIIRAFLEFNNIAPQEWNKSVVEKTMPSMLDTNHAMGGLRMGKSPDSSVVDCDLAVHGLENLYVASCAVFPSGSSSNPTFTLMALSLRLARYLAQKLL